MNSEPLLSFFTSVPNSERNSCIPVALWSLIMAIREVSFMDNYHLLFLSNDLCLNCLNLCHNEEKFCNCIPCLGQY